MIGRTIENSQLILTTAFLIGVLLSRATIRAECPTECYCDETTSTITCIGDRRLTFLPQLNLSTVGTNNGSDIRRLELRDYILQDLFIGDQEKSLFFQMTQELILSHNQIQNIEFSSMRESGSIRNPNESWTLQLLDLSVNNLTEFLSTSEMKNLKALDLSHNKIEYISLEWLLKLENLNLRSNSIQELKEDVFQSVKSLQYINLDSNLLKKLSPNLFSNSPSLVHLIISSNPLEEPLSSGGGFFFFNSRTQFIDVSNVGLTKVPSSITKTVRDLRLNGNKLKIIYETDFESYPNLGLLVLDENQIEIIEDDALGRLEFLTGLWLNGNRLTRIPQNLPTSLKSLQLEENRIKALNQSEFHPLKNLETLNLHGNQLDSLEPEIFSSLTRLRTLILRSNSIDSLYASSLANLTSLEILDLSQNPIKVIVNGAFNSLVNLNVLHLSRLTENEIQFDPKTFFPLTKLHLLDLSRSVYFTKKLLAEGSIGLESFKLLRELNIEYCELGSSELGLLCVHLNELEWIQIVKADGNSFSNATTTTATSKTNIINPKSSWASSTSTFTVIKLCPKDSSRVSEVKDTETTNITTNSKTLSTTTSFSIMSTTTSKPITKNQLESEKVPLTLSTSTTTTATITISSSSSSSKDKLMLLPGLTTSKKKEGVGNNLLPKNTTQVVTKEEVLRPKPSTSTSPPSTSSYFGESEPKKRKTKSHQTQKTNEDIEQENNGRSKSRNFGIDTRKLLVDENDEGEEVEEDRDEHRRRNSEKGSIDGFPAEEDLSSNSGSRKRTPTTRFQHPQNHDDFAKGSFHRLPQKMLLRSSSSSISTVGTDRDVGNSSGSSNNNGGRLILKTILISAGTCMLSVLILLAIGLTLFHINGGKLLVRNRRAITPRELTKPKAYQRLEDKQEVEMGITNRMYYQDGQVYHIS